MEVTVVETVCALLLLLLSVVGGGRLTKVTATRQSCIIAAFFLY